MACIEYLGIDHVMYGSDFYCSHIRGTNLPVGQFFMWLDESSEIWDQVAYNAKPVLLGLENLRAVKAAFQMLKLKDSDIEKIGISLHEAARMCALTPVEILGIDSEKGSLEYGKDADILVLDRDTYEIQAVFVKGVRVKL